MSILFGQKLGRDEKATIIMEDMNSFSKLSRLFPEANSGAKVLWVSFQEHVFPLHVTVTHNDKRFPVNYTFAIQSNVNTYRTYLLFGVSGDHAEVDAIETIDSSEDGEDSPLPKERKGSFLLSFVEKMCKLMNVKIIKLFDGASMLCEVNKQPANLSFLRTMMKGAGWYESHGYEHSDYQDYRQQVERARNTSLDDILSKIKNANSGLGYGLVDDINDFKKTSSSDHLHDFLSWLWTKDCEKYTQAVKTLYTARLHGPWGKNGLDIPRVYGSTGHVALLTKKL
jgi:hypothetical protein